MPQQTPRRHRQLGTADTVVQTGVKKTTRTDDLTAQLFRIAPETMVDHFQVIRSLGRGGTGEVYLARDTKLGRKVALKVIHVTGSEKTTTQFLREAQATARFNHPHIVTIHASGEIDGHPYVALEYLEGGDLRTRLQDGALPLAEGLRTGLAVAQALAEAHRHGILHRDLKPENVVLPVDGRVRVVDFGLAQLAHGLQDELAEKEVTPVYQLKPTQLTSLAGTPEYMSPEQWLLVEATTAVDVWAFGILLFEMLCGRVPYALTPSVKLDELARAICSTTDAPSVQTFKAVPPAVDELIAQCLAKVPTDRPTADELVARLHKLIGKASQPTLEQQNVFRGLLPYDEKASPEFFGREYEVATFLERVRVQPVLPVVGPAGAGKTSFVLAGIIPRLRERGYERVLIVRPGDDPFRAVAARVATDEDTGYFFALTDHGGQPARIKPAQEHRVARPEVIDAVADELRADPRALGFALRELAARCDSRVLLFIDQVEELFELTEDAELQRAFLSAVCLAADDFGDPVRIIFAVREHYLGHVASSDVTRQALSSVTVLRAPDPGRMEEILHRSAEMVGYVFEDDALVRDMVAEVKGEPTGLPLLSFAARQLFERRDRSRRMLLRSAYLEMGGVAGALASHADGVIDGFSPEQLRLARQMLLRLVSRDGTRRVCSREDAVAGLSQPEADEVLNRLVDARIVALRKSRTANLSTVLELTQESLIAAWGTLARWVHESREEIAFLTEVTQAAQLWDQRGRRDAELWQGAALRDGVRNHGRTTAETPDLVRQFLARGLTLERRRLWRRRGIMAAAAIASLVAVIVLVAQKREADFQRDRAVEEQHKTEQQRASALQQAARAAMRGDRMLEARAELRSAIEVEDSTQARSMWWETQRDPVRWRLPFDNVIYQIQFAPDGKEVALASQNGVVYRIDATTRDTTPLRGHADQAIRVAYSRDGKLMASGSWSGEVILRDRSDHRITRRWKAHGDAVWGIGFYGDQLLTASNDGAVRLWRLSDGGLVQSFAHDSPSRGAMLTNDGASVITLTSDGKLRRWGAKTAVVEASVDAHDTTTYAMTTSADGKRLATGSEDLTAAIWDAETLELRHRLQGHAAGVQALAFSPDGKTLATGGAGNQVRLWSTETGEPLRRHDLGHKVISIAYSPDGKRIAVSTLQETLMLSATWGATSGQRAHRTGVLAVAMTPDGKTIASGSYDGDILLWNADSGEVRQALRGHSDSVNGLRFTPNGRSLLSASADRTARVWNVTSGSQEAILGGATTQLRSADVSPDGSLMLGTTITGELLLWDARGTLLRRTSAIEASVHVRYAMFLDAGTVAVPTTEEVVLLVDWKRGRTVRRLKHPRGFAYGLTRVGNGLLALGRGKLWWWPDKRNVRELDVEAGTRQYSAVPLARNTVATVDSGGYVVLRDLAAGKNLARRKGHDAEANAIAVDEAKQRLATASDDGTVRLWTADALEPIWKTPGLVPDPVRLFSHRGWRVLEGRAPHELTALDDATTKAERAVATKGGACLVTGGHVALWLTGKDQAEASTKVKAAHLVPTEVGCAIADEKKVVTLSAEGAKTVHEDEAEVTALSATADALLVVAGGKLLRLSPQGDKQDEQPLSETVSAVTLVDGKVLVGYGDGIIERLDAKSSRLLEETPAARVVRMIPGPRNTVVAGYANGVVALWDAGSGAIIGTDRMHGPARDLVINGQKLYAASSLGQSLQWDLSPFYVDYCELVREVWEQVPYRWQQGRAEPATAPPEGHRCLEP